MKVYIVMERYEDADNYYGEVTYNIYGTKEKAIERFNKMLECALIDYDIDRSNPNLEICEMSANYISGDWENFELYVEERDVR